jgi:hypothetical protein
MRVDDLQVGAARPQDFEFDACASPRTTEVSPGQEQYGQGELGVGMQQIPGPVRLPDGRLGFTPHPGVSVAVQEIGFRDHDHVGGGVVADHPGLGPHITSVPYTPQGAHRGMMTQ